MKITKQRFVNDITNYAQSVVVPALKGNTAQFIGGMIVGLPNFPQIVEKLLPTLQALGVADDSGVDIDALDTAMKAGFASSKTLSLQIPNIAELAGIPALGSFFGASDIGQKLTFSESDWNQLKQMFLAQ